MMERTSSVLCFENLPDGKATVGFEVCAKHVAGALEGSECSVSAEACARSSTGASFASTSRFARSADHRRRHARAARDRGRRGEEGLSPAGLPDRVRIREVGPRDGFQNEPEVIPTAEKVRLIGMLASSGLRRLEVTSFVRPDVISAAGRRGGRSGGDRSPGGRQLLGPDPEREGARAGAPPSRSLRRGQPVPVRERDAQPQERQSQRGGVACRARGDDRDRPLREDPLRG